MFDVKCLSTFQTLQSALISTPIIIATDWNLPFKLICDASDYVIGAYLGQRRYKISHVIYYASHTLIEAQINYAITKKDLLAMVFAFEKFRAYLIKSKVIV